MQAAVHNAAAEQQAQRDASEAQHMQQEQIAWRFEEALHRRRVSSPRAASAHRLDAVSPVRKLLQWLDMVPASKSCDQSGARHVGGPEYKSPPCGRSAGCKRHVYGPAIGAQQDGHRSDALPRIADRRQRRETRLRTDGTSHRNEG